LIAKQGIIDQRIGTAARSSRSDANDLPGRVLVKAASGQLCHCPHLAMAERINRKRN
jgi:hypothetical protein